MSSSRLLLSCLLLTGLASAAGDTASVPEATTLVEQSARKLNPALAIQFRIVAAQALQTRHPELARKFIDATLDEVRNRKPLDIGSDVVRGLAALAPEDAVSTLPQAAPGAMPVLIGALAQAHHLDSALALYRQSLAHGPAAIQVAPSLIAQLAREQPAEAAKVFQETVATFSFDALEPSQAWSLINIAAAASMVAPGPAAEVYERILTAASAPDYGEKSKSNFRATFQIGTATVNTANSRDSVLLAAGARLHVLAPERMTKFQSVLSRWDLSAPVTVRAFGARPPAAATSSPSATIRQSLSQFRGKPTDADRAKLAIEVAGKIRELAGSEQLGLAESLCNLSTEGDLGKDALAAVAATLSQAVRANPAGAGSYMELASLVRYEHVPAPPSLPALETADAVLALREQLAQENGFTLAGLDGKSYTLAALRGRVVLLNFWATWCPPCRKEMPDMEKLYHQFERKGLAVLAVSDEPRETVAGFLAKQNYTFPILLDPDRKVHGAFQVEGIPKSFLFDREGKLVAQAIDMRTERQFLEMLKKAGLE